MWRVAKKDGQRWSIPGVVARLFSFPFKNGHYVCGSEKIEHIFIYHTIFICLLRGSMPNFWKILT